mmetsp:Transcript_8486/g.22336  ORF Transcript_8486/g.22336 Transcript_8486/m.22336 type:complete len:158 (+) Transcript_8486:48-521(+)|eukprot:CAMPEP_0185829196 /NCGR_PEP_ID=MMETSP1353-20130828/105_1 /TAXON_ID=1077150 /ORGANISM="Erythrolobus australicus, Strain CCMP3124" /LENGTH=157 /DNA_ID=CAMNT_0028526959 /DNA_START=195 /DNA_END=668 /DNA_ORIENTATION=-
MSGALLIAKGVLYFFEWIWSLCIFAVTSSDLKGGNVCAFGKMSVCDYAIAAGVIGWLLITVLALGVLAGGFMGKFGIPPKIEFATQAFLAVWFLILAIVLSAELPALRFDAINAVVAFSWMITIMCMGSAAIAFLERNKSSDPSVMGPPPSSMGVDI